MDCQVHGCIWKVRRCLGKVGDKRAVVHLIDALKDSNEDVRWTALEILEKWDELGVNE